GLEEGIERRHSGCRHAAGLIIVPATEAPDLVLEDVNDILDHELVGVEVSHFPLAEGDGIAGPIRDVARADRAAVPGAHDREQPRWSGTEPRADSCADRPKVIVAGETGGNLRTGNHAAAVEGPDGKRRGGAQERTYLRDDGRTLHSVIA